jgi:thioredoxin-like negative regulator of GroEL
MEQLVARASLPTAVCITREGAAASSALLQAVSELRSELRDQFDFVQVDMDVDPARMDALRVHREPELLLYVEGRIFERAEGAMAADELSDFLQHAQRELQRHSGDR